MYIYFLVYEVIITWMRISHLGKSNPGGVCVLCKSNDVTTRHIRLSGHTFTMTS